MSFLKKLFVWAADWENSSTSGRKPAKWRRIVALGMGLLAGLLLSQVDFAQAPTQLGLSFDTNCTRITVTGISNKNCTILYSTNLNAINPWHYLTNFVATTDPSLISCTNLYAPAPVFFRAFTALLPSNVTPITNMTWISPGNFVMGSPTNEAQRGADEVQHQVTLTKGFFIGKFLVTQADYAALVGSNPSFFSTNHYFTQTSNRPVDSVTWADATNYCALLTQQEVAAGRLPTNWTYRLPTESEWEYACRAGTVTAFYYGNQLRSGMADFDGNDEYDSASGTITNSSGTFIAQSMPVGSYQPNLWGLYDMCGNIFEWCQDWYGPYPTGAVTDPKGPASGTDHVIRAGGWEAPGYFCRSAQRDYFSSTTYDVGFRIVLAPTP